MNSHDIYRRAVSFVYPNVCPFCSKVIEYNEYYCESCKESLPYVRKQTGICENITRFYICCFYVQRARNAIFRVKMKKDRGPVYAIGKLMSEMLRDELKTADMLVPVPSGFMSKLKRGFSPAELIAKRISEFSKTPVIKAVRINSKITEQKQLSSKERIENAKISFYVNPKADVSQKRIILIDDVCTTGSTISVIAQKLSEAGAKEVCAAVFAKTLRLSKIELHKKTFRKV